MHRLRLDDVDQPDVDPLPSTCLMTVHREDDLCARLEQTDARPAWISTSSYAVHIARLPGREHAVDVNIDVLVVVDAELDSTLDRSPAGSVTSRRSQMSGVSHFVPTTAPGVPARAEAARALLPSAVVEAGAGPVARRLRERVAPDGRRVLGGRHDLGDARRRRRERPAADLRLVAARPLLPGGGILEHLDEHAADHRPGAHAVAAGIVGDIRVDKRQARGRLVQVIVDRRDDRIEVGPRRRPGSRSRGTSRSW